MNKRLLLVSAVVILAFILLQYKRKEQVDALERQTSIPLSIKMRGVNWVAGDSVTLSQFQELKEHHVEWIAQTPFGWQRTYNQPELMLSKDSRGYWGERDQGIIHTTKLAKAAGIKTLLKPHIWLLNRNNDKWIGDIEMNTEEEWQQWFSNYSAFILHYAKLAEEQEIEALCIGTELYLPAVQREQDWRKLIREIRKIYHGQLTYAANWYKEYDEIQFWDELDFIGVQAYFPLTQKQSPALGDLKRGWKVHFKQIEAVQQKYNKPVVFTEVGYKSTADAAIEPWQWLQRNQELPVSEQTQAHAYEAMFQQFWEQPWFGGMFIWKWYPHLRKNQRHHHLDFSPQQKPAAEVMSRWYAKEAKQP